MEAARNQPPQIKLKTQETANSDEVQLRLKLQIRLKYNLNCMMIKQIKKAWNVCGMYFLLFY